MAENLYLSDFIDTPVFSETTLSHTTPKVASKRFQSLKRGQIAWESKLDLHGFKTEAAREAMSQFISSQAKSHERCLLITYDKASHHGEPPLIKNLVNHWLPQFAQVMAFHTAQDKDGGHEAVYVLLKNVVHETPRITGRQGSYLAAETKDMERKRRLAEQQGERQLARVNARDHSTEEAKSSPEGELQNSILQHPELDSQRFDGIDPNLNPEPPLNSAARTEFDNERREQEMEKQLRLGNMPKFSTAPTPKGP